MEKTAHIMPDYGRYGIRGYICIATGFANVFCKNLKEATNWCKKHNFNFIRL